MLMTTLIWSTCLATFLGSAALCIEGQYAKLLTRFACHLGDSFRITQTDVNNW